MAVIPTVPQLPGHRDLSPLGRGGYSEVYRAYQEQFDRWVAVKVLTFTLTDERSQRRFLRECRLAGRLSSHPNIVTVYDAGITPDGRPYLAMELCPDGSIADGLRSRGPFDVAEALRTGIALAGALETAHRAGVVHRDIKPANVLLTSYRQPVLADFGLSIVSEHHEVSVGSDALTPYHAAPEVLERTSVAPTSDVYSLASTVYAMLAGRAAHQSQDGRDSIASLLLRILREDVPPLERADLPPSLPGTLELALARDPQARTPSALAFALALQDAQRELGVEVTEPVLMDIPASAVETPFDPPPSAPSPSPDIGDPSSLGTSPPSGLQPAPLWSPADRPGPQGDPGAAPPAAGPAPAPPATPAGPVPGLPAPAAPGDGPGGADPGWPPSPVSSPPAGNADATIQRAWMEEQQPGDRHGGPGSPAVPAEAGSDRSWLLAGPGSGGVVTDGSAASGTAPPPGAGAPGNGAAPAGTPVLPAGGAPADQGLPGGYDPRGYDPGMGGSVPLDQPSFGTVVDGEHTVHRDQLRPPASRPGPLTVPVEQRSRWFYPGIAAAVLVGVAAVGGGAALLLGGDDGGGRDDRPGRDGGRAAGADVEVPQGLTATESPAGVNLEWQGEEDEPYVVLVLSENQSPELVSADNGPSVLIPAPDLLADVGYCFTVARARDVQSAPSGQAAQAFSPPACIRGAAEDTVLRE